MLGLAILLLDSVSLLISIPIIVLTALVANSEKLKGKYASELWQNGSYNDFWSIVDIPYGTSYGSLKATLAAGCIGTVAGVVILFSFLCAAAPINRSRTGMIVSAATLLTTVIALVYSFAETYASDRVYQGPFRPNSHHLTVGVRGTYSVESWNCQTYDLRAPMQRGDSERWCALAKSSRWLTVPLLIVSFGLLLLCVRESRKARREEKTVDEMEMSNPSKLEAKSSVSRES